VSASTRLLCSCFLFWPAVGARGRRRGARSWVVLEATKVVIHFGTLARYQAVAAEIPFRSSMVEEDDGSCAGEP
jgi:hypothetical protein